MILVCDDAMGGAWLAASLRGHGLAARHVGTLHDALAALAGVLPDAVVLDLHLPGATPAEVVARVRGVYAGPLVLATGDDGAAHALAVAHRCEVLTKPHSTEALVALLQRLTSIPSRPSGR